MNYDPKIGVVGSGSNYYKGGYVRLSQINRLEIPKWIGRIENGWQQKLVQMEKDYYWRLDIRIPPLLPTPLDTWHTPPEDPSGFDPNYHVIILTPTEAHQWLTREGYDIPDDLMKLKASGDKKKKGIIRKILKIIGVALSATITILVGLEALHSLGWLEPIKDFIAKVLWHLLR